MSRDFELLQRVEQARNGVDSRHSSIDGDPGRINGYGARIDIAQVEVSPFTSPTALLDPAIRSQLSKLVLATFLSGATARVAMFTGVEAQVGAKWITGCVGEVLASAVKDRVCIIDADLALPSIHRYFSIPNECGLAALLWEASPVTHATRRIGENLWILPTGIRAGAAELTPAIWKACIKELLLHFDYIVISAPDCERYAGIAVIGAAADGAVMVLDANSTKRVTARNAKCALDAAQIKIIGSVLNNRSLPIPDFVYARL
ncbi:MAG: CpsD/CapB family tyrosine-protein kinase [Acidobacteria bacterium]|nr:CpsD/CapB family tyrosine-protein kinase [Acidobacteriota bacterium]